MKTTRRNFALTMAGAPFILRGQQGPMRARIKIDTERVIGDIDPKIYGNFIEHLGRCIEGGVFDERSPLSDANGFRSDVLDAAKKLNVSASCAGRAEISLRTTTGATASVRATSARRGWRWRGARSKAIASARTSSCSMRKWLGAQPYFCANLGTGTWDEAQQWVEYCNSSEDTAMTRLRKQNGRAQPWKVTYWGSGNEMDGPWQMGHRSADDYGKFALEAAKLMKWTDPNIKLIAAGSSNFGAGSDWTGWNRTVLEFPEAPRRLSVAAHVRRQSAERFRRVHGEFAGTRRTASRPRRASSTRPLSRRAEQPARFISPGMNGMSGIARAGNNERGRRILEERYNLEDALVVATFLNSFVNHAHIVKIANMAQLVNVIAPIFTSEKGMFLQTIYYPLQLFADQHQGQGARAVCR